MACGAMDQKPLDLGELLPRIMLRQLLMEMWSSDRYTHLESADAMRCVLDMPERDEALELMWGNLKEDEDKVTLYVDNFEINDAAACPFAVPNGLTREAPRLYRVPCYIPKPDEALVIRVLRSQHRSVRNWAATRLMPFLQAARRGS